MAYGILLTGLDLAVFRWLPLGRGADVGPGFSLLREWRSRIVMSVAIGLWLLTWLAGWWISRGFVSGSLVSTMASSFAGWLAGLGVAVAVFYLDERL